MADKYQVLGVDECGQEFFIANNLSREAADKKADEAHENYPEARSIFVEMMVDYYAEWQQRWEDGTQDMYHEEDRY